MSICDEDERIGRKVAGRKSETPDFLDSIVVPGSTAALTCSLQKGNGAKEGEINVLRGFDIISENGRFPSV